MWKFPPIVSRAKRPPPSRRRCRSKFRSSTVGSGLEGSLELLQTALGVRPSYIGQAGFPDLVQAACPPSKTLKLSLRIPPSLDATDLERSLKELLESDPPYGAHISFETEKGGAGWVAPKVAPWLEQSVERASQTYFGRGAMTFGEGGSIPFMGMLGAKYPNAQFLITGVLGPHSNAHGPNEFLDIGYAKKLTACVAQVLADERRSLL